MYVGSIPEWRDIPGYEGFQVTQYGEVRSCWKRICMPPRGGWKMVLSSEWRVLNQVQIKGGYWRVSMKKRLRMLSHRLVLLAFVGPCPEGHEARHLDGNSSNNHVLNLAWSTHAENVADIKRHGRIRGRKPSVPNMTSDEIANALSLFDLGWSIQKIATHLNRSRAAISKHVNKARLANVAS